MDDEIAMIQAMFATSGSGGYDDPGIVCPFCTRRKTDKTSYVHLLDVKQWPGRDEYAAGHHYAMGVRGDVTALRFSCEEGGHHWALVLGEHKGSIMARLVAEEGETTGSESSAEDQS